MRRTWAWVVAACFLGASGFAEAGGYPFEFKPGSPNAALGPRFKPMSSSVKLAATTHGPKQGIAHRQGSLRVGPAGSKPRRLVVSRTKPGEAFDLLVIDTDGDGSLDDETPIDAKLQSSGQTIWSSFKIVLKVNHGTAAKPEVQEHPFKGYLAVAGKTANPATFNYTSVGFRLGRVDIEGLAYDVVLSDRNNDGRYSVGDAWTIRSTEMKGPPQLGDAHGLRDAVSAGGRMWNLVLDGTAGRRARIVKEGEAAGDFPEEDTPNPASASPRADTPLAFAETIEEAQKQAAKLQGPVFLSFESESSTESLDLRAGPYGARAVVDAVPGLSCARVDVDAMRLLKVKYKVDKTPTGILLDPEGREVARFTGYQTAEALRAFFGAVHSWLEPADEEPKLDRKNRKRHEQVVKNLVAYLQDNKHQGLLVDRIKDLGTRKIRSARDALMRFASSRKSKEYIAEAFYALARIGGRISIAFLCGPKALASKDYLVAQQAGLALGLARDARAVDGILAVLTKRRTKIEVVAACCLALAQSGPKEPRVVEQIFEHARHPKDTIRSGAAEALGYLESDAAVRRLTELLQKDKNTRVRAAAALGMGHTKRTELITLLRKAIAEDKAHTVRTAALEAIRELQGEADATKR